MPIGLTYPGAIGQDDMQNILTGLLILLAGHVIASARFGRGVITVIRIAIAFALHCAGAWTVWLGTSTG